MEGESSSSGNDDLRNLLEAIRSSDVVESRVQLLCKLGDLDLKKDNSNLSSFVECLAMFWEDFTCLDMSQCILNKTILQAAAKYVDSDLSGCLVQFLALQTKATAWCGKHLKMTLMSTGESQEDEHSDHFFQLLSDFLSLSAASLMALARYNVLADNETMATVEKFVTGQLNLVKDVVLETKRIDSVGSEMLKLAQTVIDSAIRLCKDYFSAMDWDVCDERLNKDQKDIEGEELDTVYPFVSMIKSAVQKLCELGVLAAKDGGRLVNILNVSWKGVVTLLQQVKGALKKMVHVQEIILSLISLVNEHLRCAAEAWSSSLKETVSVTEARRTFLPVKFYLLNILKITSLYPDEVFLIHQDLTLCLLAISTFRMLLSSDKLLYTASEVFLDLLDNTLLDLVTSLLNSIEVKQELKFELLDWLFVEECSSRLISHLDSTNCNRMSLMVAVLSGRCEDMPGARLLLLGRVALFHTFLRCSVALDEDLKTKIARKLGWLLNTLVDEEVYSSILDMQTPVLCGSGKTMEWVLHPMFSTLLDSLKTFMIVVSSSLAWVECEYFLLENICHPHFLCWEIVTELWCFLVRHTEIDMAKGIFDKLYSLMKLVASPGLVLIPCSPLRKIARTFCWLLINSGTSIVDHVYISFVDERSQYSSVIFLALLLEGFPLNSLSERFRSTSKQKIITDYFDFMTSSEGNFLTTCCSDALGIPVFALSASLHSRQVSISDVEMKTLKFLVALVRNFRDNVDKPIVEHHCDLLSQVLWIFSYIKHLYESDQMEEVVLELQKLFMSGTPVTDSLFHQCKPCLTLFMGGLGNMEMSETDDCSKTTAVWELYHMLLRERHWALAHLAISSFGYFAASTSCNQLWRFVPENAALAYDLISGNEVNEEKFMMEFKGILEKEKALLTIAPSFEQFELLLKEGLMLKEIAQKISTMQIDTAACEDMDIDSVNQAVKRRKLPDEVRRGMELLECGLKVVGDGLLQWQQDQLGSSEIQDKFLTQLSRLQDTIAQLSGLAGYGKVDFVKPLRQ